MVNDKVEELMLGLEEEQQQSHDDDHRISSAVARGMCSKTYAEKKIAYHTGFKAPNNEEDYNQKTPLQTPAALKDSLVKKKGQGGILHRNVATDSTLNNSSSNNHRLAALSSAEVGTHKSIPIAFVDAYMKDEGPAIDSNVGPYLIKIAKAHASGENLVKGLEYCIRAVKYYEGKEAHHDDGESSSLNLVISLHVLAALHCQLGQYEDAVSVLERSLTIPDMTQGEEHALAIFAGHMQHGDTLNLAGKQGPVLQSYHVCCKSRNQLLENSIFVWQKLVTTLQKHTYRFLFLIIFFFFLFWFIFFFFLVFPFASVFFHCTSSPANCLETDVEQFWIIIVVVPCRQWSW
jgi:hypothetical protein